MTSGSVPSAGVTPIPSARQELANLRAFARLYGVLRFFHPSDEAATIDWNRYAVLGVSKIRNAKDSAELKVRLEALVHGIAPTVQITEGGARTIAMSVPAWDEEVSWQYLGPGFGPDYTGTYRAKRTARDPVPGSGESGWTTVTQHIDAESYRGKPFRLGAFARADTGGAVGAWVQVERRDGGVGFYDDMTGRLITARTWTPATIEGVIDADAERILIGAWVVGHGGAWLDDFSLTIDGRAIAVGNPGFEDGMSGWVDDKNLSLHAQSDRRYEVVTEPSRGSAALHISPGDLFTEHAAVGEVADVDLGQNLRAHVPISLGSKNGHTLPSGDSRSIQASLEALHSSLDDADARIADLIVAWSVFDQFYPYFDLVGADWVAVLDRTLHDALTDANVADHERSLRRLVAALEDGHGNVAVPGRELAALPLRLAWVDGHLVVTASATPELMRGDEITAIDGASASEALESEMAPFSGSRQWRRVRALATMGARPEGEAILLRVARVGEFVDVTVKAGPPPDRPEPLPLIATLDGGIVYFDLTRATSADLQSSIGRLAGAPGVIFDLRGYPKGANAVLDHLLREPETNRWMHVPQIFRPALPGIPRPRQNWDGRGWNRRPAQPHIEGHVVFLTDARAVSQAESILGYVEMLGIDIAGSPTAGTNGDSRGVTLPTGSRIRFTGMRVTRHDGSPFHLVGIHPTIPVEPTVAGIRAGRDEVLDRAVEAIRSKFQD